jgi:hypothetical protein
MTEHWWSIEVADAQSPASSWRYAYGSALIEAAISRGAKDWDWHHTTWGVVFEVAFDEWDAFAVYRDLPVVRAALDATPDPVNGVLIYPGRGGSSSSQVPRRPRPNLGAGAAPIPASPEPTTTVPALIERPSPVLSLVA